MGSIDIRHILRAGVLLLTVLTMGLRHHAEAQNHQYIEDTAAQIVKRYNRLLNLDALPYDSILLIESTITSSDGKDTLKMYRWWQEPQHFRLELWYHDTLTTCYYTDGRHNYRAYNAEDRHWMTINPETFYNKVLAYDIHGPLYNWEFRGYELEYEGSYNFEGHPVERVWSRNPLQWDRHYLFEKESGLLFLFTESDSLNGEPIWKHGRNRVDWHAYHEFQPIGRSMTPSVESYQSEGHIFFIFHKARFLPSDKTLFDEDRRNK